MRRAFGYELLVCPRCGGNKMMYLSVVMRRDVIDRILARAGPLESERGGRSRGPRLQSG